MEKPQPNYWSFSGNPNSYRVEDAVREVIVYSWRVLDKKVRKGDKAIIWKAKGNQIKSNKRKSTLYNVNGDVKYWKRTPKTKRGNGQKKWSHLMDVTTSSVHCLSLLESHVKWAQLGSNQRPIR